MPKVIELAGPQFPIEVVGEWGVAQVQYVVDARGKCWSGSPRGWAAISGDRQELMSKIGTTLRGQHVAPSKR